MTCCAFFALQPLRQTTPKLLPICGFHAEENQVFLYSTLEIISGPKRGPLPIPIA
jgi:hypothetical protein